MIQAGRAESSAIVTVEKVPVVAQVVLVEEQALMAGVASYLLVLTLGAIKE